MPLTLEQTMRTVIYTRASTAKQEMSTETQLEICRSGIRMAGLAEQLGEIEEVEDKAQSGFYIPFQDRIKGRDIYKRVQSGDINCIVVVAVDRISRDAADGIQLDALFRDKGVRIISVTESIDTERDKEAFMMQLRYLLAQQERDRISTRTGNTAKHIKAIIEDKGYHVSKAGNKITQLGTPLRGEEAVQAANQYRYARSDLYWIDIYPRIMLAARSVILEKGENVASWEDIAARLQLEGVAYLSPKDGKQMLWNGTRVRNVKTRLVKAGVWNDDIRFKTKVKSRPMDSFIREAELAREKGREKIIGGNK